MYRHHWGISCLRLAISSKIPHWCQKTWWTFIIPNLTRNLVKSYMKPDTRNVHAYMFYEALDIDPIIWTIPDFMRLPLLNSCLCPNAPSELQLKVRIFLTIYIIKVWQTFEFQPWPPLHHPTDPKSTLPTKLQFDPLLWAKTWDELGELVSVTSFAIWMTFDHDFFRLTDSSEIESEKSSSWTSAFPYKMRAKKENPDPKTAMCKYRDYHYTGLVLIYWRWMCYLLYPKEWLSNKSFPFSR